VAVEQARTIGRWGPLELPMPPGTPLGPCQFSLRFEATRIGAQGGDVTATGTVVDIVFLGDSSEITVALDGLSLTAKETAQAGFDLAVGTPVTVSFASADVVRIHG
jgi:ABC-type Fe3+/spermidine/putrescine transport system ATPase subunit